jgi:ankyrin repeat protein/beta-lactamase regulating signal transducer with metallopeptidase domain
MFNWMSGFGNPNEWVAGVILDTALKGTVFFLVLWVILRFALRSATASIRYTTCVLAASGLLLLPFVSTLAPRWRIPLPEAVIGLLNTDPGNMAETPGAPSREEDLGENGMILKTIPSPSSSVSRQGDSMFRAVETPVTPESVRTEKGENSVFPLPRVSGGLQALKDKLPAVPTVALGIWTGGAFLSFLPWFVGLIALYRLLRKSRRVEQGPWLQILEETCRSMAMPSPRLYQTDLPLVPMAGGFFRAFIIVPSDARLWSKDKMRHVLIHELGHIRRHDDLTYLPVRVAASLHWFNPLAWTLLRILRFERERACDDFVLNQGITSCDYASHLLEIMKDTISIHPAMLAASPMATPRRLEKRVLAILDDKMNRKGLTMRHFMIVTIATSLLTLCIGAATVAETATSSEGTPRVLENVPESVNPDPATSTENVPSPESNLLEKNSKQGNTQEGSQPSNPSDQAPGSSDSRISLFEAARTGQAGAIEKTVEEKARINACDENGKTALHYAAENGHGETACTLIKLGADPSIRDREGRTALDLAIQKGHTGTAEMLKSATANSRISLFEAARTGQAGAIEQAVKEGAPINTCDGNGKTALHYAAENGHGETACTLIKLGADPSIRDQEGQTALDLAIQKGHTGTAEMLKSAIASVEKPSDPASTSSSSPLAIGEKWNLWLDANHKERPPVEDGLVTLSIGKTGNMFPQYLNELGIHKIRLRFAAQGESQKRFSFVFSGGSLGPDRFQVQLDGRQVSQSPVIKTAQDPYTYYRHQFIATLGAGNEHVLEISSPEKYRDSAIEFSAIEMNNSVVGKALPLEKLWSDAGR